MALMRAAKKQNNIVAASIFVNPAQFAPHEDFDRYPRTLEKDLQLLQAEGVDWVFVPEKEEMYPPGYKTYVEVFVLQAVSNTTRCKTSTKPPKKEQPVRDSFEELPLVRWWLHSPDSFSGDKAVQHCATS